MEKRSREVDVDSGIKIQLEEDGGGSTEPSSSRTSLEFKAGLEMALKLNTLKKVLEMFF